MPKKDVDALFDSWDPDGSGTLSFKELQKILRAPANQEQAQANWKKALDGAGDKGDKGARKSSTAGKSKEAAVVDKLKVAAKKAKE